MTNTENTITRRQLANELDVMVDELGTAAWMLGLRPVPGAFVVSFTNADAERIREWVKGHGGQSEDGGVY